MRLEALEISGPAPWAVGARPKLPGYWLLAANGHRRSTPAVREAWPPGRRRAARGAGVDLTHRWCSSTTSLPAASLGPGHRVGPSAAAPPTSRSKRSTLHRGCRADAPHSSQSGLPLDLLQRSSAAGMRAIPQARGLMLSRHLSKAGPELSPGDTKRSLLRRSSPDVSGRAFLAR